MIWSVIETRDCEKAIRRLPALVQKIYRELVEDLKQEGPNPYGWDVSKLRGQAGLRIKLTREYRVIIEIVEPDIFIVKAAHRKEVYL